MEAPREPRVAHVLQAEDPSQKPVIIDKATKLPLLLRQHAADKFFEVLKERKPIEEAIKSALELELQLYMGTKKKSVYKNNFMGKLAALKSPKPDPVKASLIRYDEVVNRLEEMLVTPELLEQINFPCAEKSIRVERQPAQELDCSRCKKAFVPSIYYRMEDPEACHYHYGRLQNVRNVATKIYSCCNAEASGTTCTMGKFHVYLNKSLFTDDQLIVSAQHWTSKASHFDILALDGEMCHTEAGLDLCRLTMIDWDETRVLDVLIKPNSTIVDYNTRFSGLSEASYAPDGFNAVVPEGFEPRVYSFSELNTDLLPALMGPHTILVGHSLENDLFHLKLDHKRIIDTSVLYPHNKGQPYRMALRDLTRVHLKQFVQEGSGGHDSYEDCVACLRLLKLKL